MISEFARYPERTRTAAYEMAGTSYNSNHGPTIMKWFVEKTIADGVSGWHKRYELFAAHLARKVPQTTLYRVLGKMAITRVLDFRTDESGAHSFKLNEEYLSVLAAMADFQGSRKGKD